jgi:hypothetical protein
MCVYTAPYTYAVVKTPMWAVYDHCNKATDSCWKIRARFLLSYFLDAFSQKFFDFVKRSELFVCFKFYYKRTPLLLLNFSVIFVLENLSFVTILSVMGIVCMLEKWRRLSVCKKQRVQFPFLFPFVCHQLKS